jgi:DNA invertase Pin-like site-specific DNA recombinase
MPDFVCYLRVSTDRQGALGLGIEAQREAVERYVASVGGRLISEHVEVETGRSAKRPVLLEAIAQCRRERAVLLIARLDRLARSVSFIASLMDGGVEFVAADNPAATKMVLQMLAVFSEFERDQIAARTKAALAAAKARGVKLGTNGRVLADKHQADALIFAQSVQEPIEAAMSAGATTLNQVADHLNGLGVTTREGSSWRPATVHLVLRRLGLRTAAMA